MSKQNQGNCAVSHAVIRRYLQARPGFTPDLLHVRLVLRRATVRQLFLKELFFRHYHSPNFRFHSCHLAVDGGFTRGHICIWMLSYSTTKE